MIRFYALEILRIGLGFTGRFPYAGELQILLLKTSPKQASEEGRIMTDQTLGRSNSGPVRLPVHTKGDFGGASRWAVVSN